MHMHLIAPSLKLHRFALSGHCHRVELFLSLLKLPVELIDVDLAGKAHKTPAFLALNPFGQVPVLQDGELTLADSNAILVYLAGKYGDESWWPRDPAGQAAIQQWLSIAAGPLAFGPAAARVAHLFKEPLNVTEASKRAETLFAVMEQILAKSAFLTGNTPAIADIANYSYTAHAPEGNISLDPYPAINAWLVRIEQLPGFVPMAKTTA